MYMLFGEGQSNQETGVVIVTSGVISKALDLIVKLEYKYEIYIKQF